MWKCESCESLNYDEHKECISCNPEYLKTLPSADANNTESKTKSIGRGIMGVGLFLILVIFLFLAMLFGDQSFHGPVGGIISMGGFQVIGAGLVIIIMGALIWRM